MNYGIVSPLMLTSVPWILSIFLYSFFATENLVPLPIGLLLLVLIFFTTMGFSTVISYYPTRVYPKLAKRKFDNINIERLKRLAKIQFIAWIFGSLIEIVDSGGLPLIWIITGGAKNYTEFGIPSFHGLMNALYFSILGCSFLLYQITKQKKYISYTVIMSLWPIMMLGRGILLTIIVQLTIMNLFFNGLNYKKTGYFFILSIAVIFIFGLVGDFRGFSNPFQNLVVEKYYGIFESLPSGFLWFYIYVTSPISNLAYNFDSLNPVYDFYFSTVNLFPSFLRPDNLDRADNFVFLNIALNVSTIFSSSHSDFGFFGNILLIVLLALWAGFWFNRLKFSAAYILPYSLVGSVLIFSIFYNLFLLYPYLFATVLMGIVAKLIRQ